MRHSHHHWLALTVAALLLPGAWSWPWEAYTTYTDGARAFNDKRFDDSIEAFERGVEATPDQALPYYNLGNAYYQNKNYAKAIESYQKSLEQPADAALKGQVYYNLGNSLYRQGQSSGEPAKDWQLALESYEKALQYLPQDQETIENRDFVKTQLEKLQQLNQNGQSGNSKNEKQPSASPSAGPSSKPNQKSKSSPSPNPAQSAQSPSSEPSQSNNNTNNQTGQPPPKYSQEEIQRFLNSMEQRERMNRSQQLFRRFPQKNNPTGDVFNMSPEELMALSPEELEKLFAQNRNSQSSQKDW